MNQLKAIREASTPLNLTSIRGLMIGILEVQALEIFTQYIGSHGGTFRCSNTFVGCFIKRQLGWSKRKGTQAGQKLPADALQQMKSRAFRLALDIRDHSIPASCCTNSDQTGCMLGQSGESTYNVRADFSPLLSVVSRRCYS